MNKKKLAFLIIGGVLFVYGAYFLPRPLMALAFGSLVIFLAK